MKRNDNEILLIIVIMVMKVMTKENIILIKY